MALLLVSPQTLALSHAPAFKQLNTLKFETASSTTSTKSPFPALVHTLEGQRHHAVHYTQTKLVVLLCTNPIPCSSLPLTGKIPHKPVVPTLSKQWSQWIVYVFGVL